jgi:endonuclease YncB( thermonuclease family)
LAVPSAIVAASGALKSPDFTAAMARAVCLVVGIIAPSVALTFSTTARSTEYTGPVVSIVDGDTFDMRTPSGTIRIRFCGVDSPERGEPGYQTASDALRRIIGGKIVRCLQVGGGTPCDGRSRPTNRDRIVAQCFIGKVDIAEEMVRGKHACDWPRFSGGHYRVSAATCTNSR